MNKAILVAGGGASQVYLVEALVKLKIKIVLVDQDASCPCRPFADLFINESTHDGEKWLDSLSTTEPHLQIVGLLTSSSGPPVRSLARVARKLNIPLYSCSAAELATSKLTFRKCFDAVKCRKYSPDVILTNEEWPIIVKADYTRLGKESVRWANNNEQLVLAVERVMSGSLGNNVLIESYVEGKDYIFVGLVRDGTLVFLVPYLEKNKFIDDGSLKSVGIMGPLEVDNNFYEYVVSELNELIDKFEIVNCPISFSVRVSEQNFYPIELHLDFGGESVFDWLLRPVFSDGIVDVLRILLHKKESWNGAGKYVASHCNAVLYNCSFEKIKKAQQVGINFISETGNGWLVSGPKEKLIEYMAALSG